MCGGFTCSKNALIALNVLYVVVASILISVAVYGQASSLIGNLPIVGGILACGVFLILISILGLAGAVKHHQVMLFFYMVILFLLFLVQFSVACACLAVNSGQQELLAQQGWNRVNMDVKEQIQERFLCCGFQNRNVPINGTAEFPTCDIVDKICCSNMKITRDCLCQPCMEKLKETIDYAFKLCGGIGLFFSFTEWKAVPLLWNLFTEAELRGAELYFLTFDTANGISSTVNYRNTAAQLPFCTLFPKCTLNHYIDVLCLLFAVWLARRYRNQPDPNYKEPHAIFPMKNYLY